MKQKLVNGFVISLDFELFWGSTDTMKINENQVKKYRATRKAIPRLLDLFLKYNISSTWATVGFLFAESAEEILNDFSNDEPQYNDLNHSTYERLRRIENDFHDCYFALDLIELIKNTPYQEIASHTFSHYYTFDDNFSPDRFSADLAKSQKISKSKIGLKHESIVFPRNQVTLLSELAKNEITIYRDNPKGWAYAAADTEGGRNFIKRIFRLIDRYFPISKRSSYNVNDVQSSIDMVNVPASRFLPPISKSLVFFDKLRLNRIKSEMLKAAKNNDTYHLWWHPHNMGSMTDEYFKFLESILIYFNVLKEKYDWASLTMKNVANLKNNDI